MSRAKRIARASRTLILRIRSRQVAGSNPAGGSERRTSPRQRRTDAEARTFRLAPTCQVLGAACDSSKPCCDLTTPPQALLALCEDGVCCSGNLCSKNEDCCSFSSGFLCGGRQGPPHPRWTPQNRPLVDGSKPAIFRRRPGRVLMAPRLLRVNAGLLFLRCCARGFYESSPRLGGSPTMEWLPCQAQTSPVTRRGSCGRAELKL
jgi:hypothetical protein